MTEVIEILWPPWLRGRQKNERRWRPEREMDRDRTTTSLMKLSNPFFLLFSPNSNKIYIYIIFIQKVPCVNWIESTGKEEETLELFLAATSINLLETRSSSRRLGLETRSRRSAGWSLLVLKWFHLLTLWENASIFLKFQRTFGKVYSTSENKETKVSPNVHLTLGHSYAVSYK